MNNRKQIERVAIELRRSAMRSTMRALFTQSEQSYILSCSVRVGSSTAVFTRDEAMVSGGFVADITHDRCWHLSLVCETASERAQWLHAMFGDRAQHVWAESLHGIEHWRLFCDAAWRPIEITNAADLRRAGLVPRDEFTLCSMPRVFAA